MALDTWLEQDIRTFLDEEARGMQNPMPARLEDAESVVSTHDWSREIQEKVKHGDAESAKKLFSKLRERYKEIPENHEEERAKLYSMLQDSYAIIANLVLEKWRTNELLRRMESSPGDIFDASVKSVDLSTSERTHAAIPDLIPFTKDSLKDSDIFSRLDHIGSPETEEALSFEPEALLKANLELNQRVKRAEQSVGVFDQTVRELTRALKLALTDTKGSLAALDALMNKPLQEDVKAAAQELKLAILEREEMIAFTKKMGEELSQLHSLAVAQDALTIPTANRLRQQLEKFAQTHPHYPMRHRQSLLRRIDHAIGLEEQQQHQMDHVQQAQQQNPGLSQNKIQQNPFSQNQPPNIQQQNTPIPSSAREAIDTNNHEETSFVSAPVQRNVKAPIPQTPSPTESLRPFIERIEQARATSNLVAFREGLDALEAHAINNLAPTDRDRVLSTVTNLRRTLAQTI